MANAECRIASLYWTALRFGRAGRLFRLRYPVQRQLAWWFKLLSVNGLTASVPARCIARAAIVGSGVGSTVGRLLLTADALHSTGQRIGMGRILS